MNNKKNILIVFAVFAAILMLVPPTMGRITQDSTTKSFETTKEYDCPLCAQDMQMVTIDKMQEGIEFIQKEGLVPEGLSDNIEIIAQELENSEETGLISEELSLQLQITMEELEQYDTGGLESDELTAQVAISNMASNALCDAVWAFGGLLLTIWAIYHPEILDDGELTENEVPSAIWALLEWYHNNC